MLSKPSALLSLPNRSPATNCRFARWAAGFNETNVSRDVFVRVLRITGRLSRRPDADILLKALLHTGKLKAYVKLQEFLPSARYSSASRAAEHYETVLFFGMRFARISAERKVQSADLGPGDQGNDAFPARLPLMRASPGLCWLSAGSRASESTESSQPHSRIWSSIAARCSACIYRTMLAH